jgi:hypothetical protein
MLKFFFLLLDPSNVLWCSVILRVWWLKIIITRYTRSIWNWLLSLLLTFIEYLNWTEERQILKVSLSKNWSHFAHFGRFQNEDLSVKAKSIVKTCKQSRKHNNKSSTKERV